MRKPLSDFRAFVTYLAETELEAYAYRLVRDRTDAGDVVRDVVQQALANEDAFDQSEGPEGLRDWLRERCRNATKSYVPFGKWEESPVFGDQCHGVNDDWIDKLKQQAKEEHALFLFSFTRPLLTDLQQECFSAILAGEKQVVTARRLGITPQVVNQHLKAAQRKVNHPVEADFTRAECRRDRARREARSNQLAERAYARHMFDRLLQAALIEQEEARVQE